MRLRSRKGYTVSPETLSSNNRRSNRATPRRTRTPVAGSAVQTESEETLETESHHSSDEIPTMRRRPLRCCRLLKRAAEPGLFGKSFSTPVRSILRPERVLSEIDPVTPRNPTATSAYSPIVRFLTPSKENVESDAANVLVSPEQGVFGYGSIDLLAGDEEDDVFSPCKFIKNIPSHSQYSKPQLRDIPPKTRSTPEATLVVDLDETLMFSSLTVIDEAEYTFYTSFQDRQYKVYMILRPHVKEFLQSMAKVFELFVYTCAKREFGEKILNVLDPQRKLFRHRLYRDDCTCVLGHYVKDLGILGRDLAKTVVVDNAPHTYPYHLMNTIHVKSWSGDTADRELQRLIPTLEKLSAAEDFQEVLKKRRDHFHRLLSED
ncbi:CTD small phosphatase-like protein 3 [Brachionichthys hirsutus]|uniref:CTD small phosphatase-like protein 3 n=1 Tax=Brachionichthys hirsutus TaxID=412623 RepID=UPI0036046F43